MREAEQNVCADALDAEQLSSTAAVSLFTISV